MDHDCGVFEQRLGSDGRVPVHWGPMVCDSGGFTVHQIVASLPELLEWCGRPLKGRRYRLPVADEKYTNEQANITTSI